MRIRHWFSGKHFFRMTDVTESHVREQCECGKYRWLHII